MALLSGRTWSEWIDEYARSHRHPVNRACHTIGIPLVVLSLLVATGALFQPILWMAALGLFVVGWIFQFVGHAYEGTRPEFFKDLRFLLVGVRWWLDKTKRAGLSE
jgi:uncharacterized membrane protein YGL010W